MPDNKLYYGDNLDIPKRRGRDATYPRLQLLTVKELLEGPKLQLPEDRVDVTFKKVARAKAKQRALGERDDS
jgi:hypothetical protein